MKTDFILYKENSNKPIIVNEQTNKNLLQRCQDNWQHKLDIKYFSTKKWYNNLGIKVSRNKTQIDFLFIHIPKTGGISFKFNVIYNPYMNKKVMIYHKINFPAKKKSELDIFNEKKPMFTLLREPSKTVISAYYHFNHITKMSMVDFCNKFKNIQIKFLMGYDIFSDYEVTKNDLDRIINIIKQKKLVVGIHKTKKMKDIYNLLELPYDKIDNYVLNKKINVKYKPSDISNDFRKHIKKINSFDKTLYEKVLNS